MTTYTKRSDGVTRIGVDWTKRLAPNNASITSSSWVKVGGTGTLAFTDPDEQDTRATALCGGGTGGQSYTVRNRIETSDGQVLDSDRCGADITVVVTSS